MQSREEINNNTQKLSILDKIMEKKAIIILGLLTIVALTGAVFFLSKSSNTTTDIPEDQIVARTGLHWHPALEIYINGEKQEIPSNVGIGAIHQPIHTHDEDAKDGVLHMEFSRAVSKDDTKLGNFFRTWGKKFSSTQLFDKTNNPEKAVSMIVNGKENKEFENYQMQEGDRIEIRYE